jgi:hypothetical protein
MERCSKTHNQAAPLAMNQGHQASQHVRTAVRCPAGQVRSASIGHHLPLLGLVGPAAAVGSVGMAALGAAGALAVQPVTAVRPSDDRPGAGGGPTGAALAVELHDYVGTQGGVLLLAADPMIQLGLRLGSGRDGTRVERHKHRVQVGVAGCPLR